VRASVWGQCRHAGILDADLLPQQSNLGVELIGLTCEAHAVNGAIGGKAPHVGDLPCGRKNNRKERGEIRWTGTSAREKLRDRSLKRGFVQNFGKQVAQGVKDRAGCHRPGSAAHPPEREGGEKDG